MTDKELEEIEARVAHYEKKETHAHPCDSMRACADMEKLGYETVPALVAEVRKLRALAEDQHISKSAVACIRELQIQLKDHRDAITKCECGKAKKYITRRNKKRME